MILADAGAEVIKVEKPGAGDARRKMGPFIEVEKTRHSWGFAEFNRNKKSVALDLQREEGMSIFIDLAARSDVMVENFRPGVMERLGLGYPVIKEVNPSLIYCALSGFGHTQGPYSDRPAFDVVAEAMSGFMHMVGFGDRPPVSALFGLADLVTAYSAVQGILMALLDRAVTGEGQMVDVSMLDAMVFLNERALTIHSFTGMVPSRGPERFFGPRGAFKAKDGYIAMNIPSDYMWERLALAMGREDLAADPRCADGPSRAAHAESLITPAIEDWLKDKGIREAAEILASHGVPAGPVHTAEDVFNCPQVEARGMLVPIENGPLRGRRVVKSPSRFSRAPAARAGWVPALGEHTEEVLRELVGLDQEALKRLRSEGVIQ
jgi:formyl-CoA transferase